MNTPVLFLLGAVALSALGGMIVWVLSRPRPERFGSTIESFSRDLDALAPPGTQRRSAPTGPGARNPAAQRPRRSPAPRATNATAPRATNATAPRPAAAQSRASRPASPGPTTPPRPRPGPRPTQNR